MTSADDEAIAALEAQIAEMDRLIKRTDVTLKAVTVGTMLFFAFLIILSVRAGDWRGAIAIAMFGAVTAYYYQRAGKLLESNTQLRDQVKFWRGKAQPPSL
jgi:hypothetical protein